MTSPTVFNFMATDRGGFKIPKFSDYANFAQWSQMFPEATTTTAGLVSGQPSYDRIERGKLTSEPSLSRQQLPDSSKHSLDRHHNTLSAVRLARKLYNRTEYNDPGPVGVSSSKDDNAPSMTSWGNGLKRESRDSQLNGSNMKTMQFQVSWLLLLIYF